MVAHDLCRPIDAYCDFDMFAKSEVLHAECQCTLSGVRRTLETLDLCEKFAMHVLHPPFANCVAEFIIGVDCVDFFLWDRLRFRNRIDSPSR